MAHQRWAVVGVATLLMLLGTCPALGQELELEGQVRPRLETRDALEVDHDGDVFTSMRTRIGLRATLDAQARALVQFQDVRLWGEEVNTLADATADRLDLHQAWAELGRADAATLRVGRQEARYGAERLIGAVDWTQQGRALDGLRASVPVRRARIDGFAFQLADARAPAHAADASLLGLYATLPMDPSRAAGPGADATAVEAFALWNRDAGTSQATVGARWLGRAGVLGWRAEAAWQTGERAGLEVAASLVSAEAGAQLARGLRVAAAWDRLSGDDDAADDRQRAFDTLFATNHRFYGLADLFTDLPAHTGGRGLSDFALKATWRPSGPLAVSIDAHRFLAAADDGLSDARFADEIDVTVAWRLGSGIGLSGGVFLVEPGDAMSAIGRPDDRSLSTFLMLDAGF